MSSVVGGPIVSPLGFFWQSADERIAARTIGGPAYPEMIEEVDRELTKVIEDFDRAINVEALRLANETSTHSFSQSVDS